MRLTIIFTPTNNIRRTRNKSRKVVYIFAKQRRSHFNLTIFFTKTIQNNNLAIIRKDDAKICENETWLADFQTLLECSFTKRHLRYAEIKKKKPHCISTC